MILDQYLRLPDWTGRHIRKDKVEAIPAGCPPILERRECTAGTWVHFIRNFRKRSRNEASLPQSRQDFPAARRKSRSSARATV
jgi:hypothetical protein